MVVAARIAAARRTQHDRQGALNARVAGQAGRGTVRALAGRTATHGPAHRPRRLRPLAARAGCSGWRGRSPTSPVRRRSESSTSTRRPATGSGRRSGSWTTHEGARRLDRPCVGRASRVGRDSRRSSAATAARRRSWKRPAGMALTASAVRRRIPTRAGATSCRPTASARLSSPSPRTRIGPGTRSSAPGLTIVTALDEAYPCRLRAIEVAPPVLFVRGDVTTLDRPQAVAVVGTRRPSQDGIRLAARISGAIARAGATVVSGLADGIDGVAHRTALAEAGADDRRPWLGPRPGDAGGASGSRRGDRPSRWRRRLPVPAGRAPASSATFPIRNRTISGLADATVIVEAPIRSGALITARAALAQGRECFVVPGPIGRSTTAGSIALLREHPGLARVVAGVQELLADLALERSQQVTLAAAGIDLSALEAGLASAIAEGMASVESLAATFDLAPAAVLGDPDPSRARRTRRRSLRTVPSARPARQSRGGCGASGGDRDRLPGPVGRCYPDGRLRLPGRGCIRPAQCADGPRPAIDLQRRARSRNRIDRPPRRASRGRP